MFPSSDRHSLRDLQQTLFSHAAEQEKLLKSVVWSFSSQNEKWQLRENINFAIQSLFGLSVTLRTHQPVFKSSNIKSPNIRRRPCYPSFLNYLRQQPQWQWRYRKGKKEIEKALYSASARQTHPWVCVNMRMKISFYQIPMGSVASANGMGKTRGRLV